NSDIGVTDSNSTGTYSNPPSTNWTIGNYPGLSSRFFNGLLDDVRIYSRALSASEIKQLYNMGK
ncbi:MAG: LamG-like jellyroll fold domain-containing protein, partial [bacterium]|nr:LamG-like jellyroll fold domain-containing protein [bacterium]